MNSEHDNSPSTADAGTAPRGIPLKVLPDPQRVQRILENAESHQRDSARESAAAEDQPANDSGPDNSAPVDGIAPAAEEKNPFQRDLEQRVIEVLKSVYDPEIPVNIYELGLIYGIEAMPDGAVNVRMTLTAPACPVADSMPGEIEKRLEAIPQVTSANVLLVWDPPWSRDRLSEEAKLELGIDL